MGDPSRNGGSHPQLPVAGTTAALQESTEDEDPRRALVDLATTATGIGTFDWNLVSGELAWDDQLIELFGYDPDGFDRTIDSFLARVHPDDLSWLRDLLQHTVDTCGDYEAEYRIVLPDGAVRWVAARGRALCDEQGRAVRLLGVAWDISSPRHAEDHLAGVLEAMAVGYLRVDSAWIVTQANAEVERVTGTARAELLGRPLEEALPAALGRAVAEQYRQAAASGQPVGFDTYCPAPLDVWVEVRAVPGPGGLALYLLDVTGRRRADEAVTASVRRAELLARVTSELSERLDPEHAVATLAQLVVPTLADWCIVTLVDEQSHPASAPGLRDVACWHVDERRRATVERYAAARLGALAPEAFVFRVLTATGPILVPSDASESIRAFMRPGQAERLLRELAPRHAVVLPLRARGRTVGALSLFTGPDRPQLGEAELHTAMQIAGRAGLALDNARLYRQQRELAEGLQRSLLTAPPEPDHLEVVVRYVPAGRAAQVGGDWYDAFLQPGGATVLVIGDVVGHDLQAAAVMGQIRTIVRTLGAQAADSPAEILRRADQVMETLQVETAATAVVARLEQSPEEREHGRTTLRWSNAGHPPPMVIDPEGRVRALTAPTTDRLLGVTPDAPRQNTAVVLERGGVVLLYTDGLVERRDQLLDDGLERLERTLAELADRGLDELCDELLGRMLPANPDDDVALVAVRLHPEDRPRPPEAGPNRVPPHL